MTAKGPIMVVYTTSVRVRRFRLRRLAVLIIFMSGTWTLAQTAPSTLLQRLYFVAATPSEKIPETYPATLYQTTDNKALKVIRQVVPQNEGIRIVRASDDDVFLLHPSRAVTTVSIIHTDNPSRVDNVVFSRQGIFPDEGWTVVAAPPNSPVMLMIPWFTDTTDLARLKMGVAAISSATTPSGSRVVLDRWNDFAYVHLDGDTGGPEPIMPSGVIARDGE